MPRKIAAPRKAPKRATAKAAVKATPSVRPSPMPLFKLAQELRRWTDNVLGVAGSAAELGLNMAQANAKKPAQRAAIEKAGGMLRKAREAAGLTTRELGQAIDLQDPALIEQAERGAAALPVEVILRLGSALGRHDQMAFAMKLARTYNPQLWKLLDDFGVGRLVEQAGRERELANIYRANDAARRVSDKDFAEIVGFTKTSFDMAVQFRAPPLSAKPK